MKRWIAVLLASTLALWQAPAQSQGRLFSQAELEALLAPVALYPDTVLSHVLVAATYPDDVREAAAWSRANPHLGGEQAVAAAEPMPWHPSLKTLTAFPDLLARMDESPQWTADLGQAFLEQEPYVMDTVQALRRRAHASGTLQSNEYQVVQDYGPSIAVYPAHPTIVYVPYYNPYVAYGPWWHSYRPVYWRPWHARPPVRVAGPFFSAKIDWHRRHVVRHAEPHWKKHRSPAHATIHKPAHFPRPIVGEAPRVFHQPQAVRSPSAEQREHRQRREHREPRVERPRHFAPHVSAPGIFQKPGHAVRPIVQSAPRALPQPRAAHRRDFRESRHRSEPRGSRHQGGHQGRGQRRGR